VYLNLLYCVLSVDAILGRTAGTEHREVHRETYAWESCAPDARRLVRVEGPVPDPQRREASAAWMIVVPQIRAAIP
jgi:hypothetical protein